MTTLKVMVVHNRYRHPGGEDAVVDAEVGLLREHGHDVDLYLRDNDEMENLSALGAFAQAMWSRRTWDDVVGRIDAFRPDLIHVHNTFALVSASVYWAARRHGIPVVQTLHNFRLLCAQAMFLRDNRVCEDCIGRVPWRAVTRKCYRDSALQSAALASIMGVHRALGTFRGKVTRYIALTDFCREKFIEGGLPSQKIVVKPNFVEAPPPPPAGPRRRGLFVGRLAAEKGIDVLVEALQTVHNLSIDVVGSGPMEHMIKDHPRVNFLGWLAPREIFERMRRAAYLVMPSIWYENFPRTLVEAFANGLPVIASHLGALRELVDHGETGLVFEPGSGLDLARHIAWAESFPARMRAMGENARKRYEARFTPERNYRQLMQIYRDAIAADRLELAG